MNKLTAKSKKDFLEYITDKHFSIDYEKEGTCEYLWIGNDIDLTLENLAILNALIIEWFDSVGIYIEINVNQITDKNIPKCNFNSAIFHVKHRTKEGRTLTQLKVNTTRQEATEKAIEQANLIYNGENN